MCVRAPFSCFKDHDPEKTMNRGTCHKCAKTTAQQNSKENGKAQRANAAAKKKELREEKASGVAAQAETSIATGRTKRKGTLEESGKKKGRLCERFTLRSY